MNDLLGSDAVASHEVCAIRNDDFLQLRILHGRGVHYAEDAKFASSVVDPLVNHY